MKIEGKNAVLEALKSQSFTVDSLLVLKGENSQITRLARENRVKIQYVDKLVLDKQSQTGRHQGYILTVSEFEYSEIDDVLKGKENPLLVILEELNDPHNFGSVIRVCECAGVDGIVIAKNRQIQVNETVARCSAGAVAHTKIVRVTNLNRTIEELQEKGFWVFAADMDGTSIFESDLRGKVALVIGGEGAGVSRLTREKCDGIVKIPMYGQTNSLNASVACGIVVFEAIRQRTKK